MRILLPAAIVGFAAVLCALSGCGDDSGSVLSGSTGGGSGASGASGAGGRAGSAGTGPDCHALWRERILKDDCTLDPVSYASTAEQFSTVEVMKWRFGPGYADLHNRPDDAPTIPADGNSGIGGAGDPTCIQGSPAMWTDWFSMAGQLAYVPDTLDDPGVALARNGSLYCDQNEVHVFDYRVSFTPDFSNPWCVNPDWLTMRQSWKDLEGGSQPRVPVAVARSRYMIGVAGLAIYASGLVGVVATGNDPNHVEMNNAPAIKLGAGKVPTAVAMTLDHEFGLVTVWDTVQKRGQVAVIAIEGNPPAIPPGPHFNGSIWMWGVPNWPGIRALKLLGYVDLPIAAPTSIEATADVPMDSGRQQPDNLNLDLSQQAQRDLWNNDTGSSYQHLAHAGYAIIASRAESKVVFLDLQPLYQYYRKMYLTTQANWQATTSSGQGPDEWPYAFSHAPEQAPVVAATLDAPRPTAVAAGYARGPGPNKGFFANAYYWDDTLSPGEWDDDSFTRSAFVATLAGDLLVLDVGNLNRFEAGAKSTPTVVRTVFLGANVVTLDYGMRAWHLNPNNLYAFSRGERTLYRLRANGEIVSQMRDSRMIDPVSMTMSINFRACGAFGVLSVMDFTSRKVINYSYMQKRFRDERPGTIEWNWVWGYTTDVPGMPYSFSVAEVM